MRQPLPTRALWSRSIPDEDCPSLSWFRRIRGPPARPIHGRHATDGGNGSSDLGSAGGCRSCRSGLPVDRFRPWTTTSVIGPGGACTRAGAWLSPEWRLENLRAPIGQAGNGTGDGARRSWACSSSSNRRRASPATVADISRITHQDPRSIAGGVAVAKAAQLLAAGHSGRPNRSVKRLPSPCNLTIRNLPA